MKNAKKYPMFLAVLPLLVAFFFVLLPVKSDAAVKTTNYIGWWSELATVEGVKTNRTIEIEAGQSFELAPYFSCQVYQEGYGVMKSQTGDNLSMTFVSSKPTIASVTKKSGTVTAKKAGTTKITATYKGKKYICTLKVKKKGSLGMTTTYKKLNTAAKALAKYKNTKVTSKNISSILTKYANYVNQCYQLKKNISHGFEMKKTSLTNKLVLPSAIQVDTVEIKLLDYLNSHDVVMTLKPASASGKGGSGSISVKMNKAPTKTQIHISQAAAHNYQELLKFSSSTTFDVEVRCDGYVGNDENNPDYENWDIVYYYAVCKIKAGSNTATITNITLGDNKSAIKLKKDYMYTIELNNKEISFVAK